MVPESPHTPLHRAGGKTFCRNQHPSQRFELLLLTEGQGFLFADRAGLRPQASGVSARALPPGNSRERVMAQDPIDPSVHGTTPQAPKCSACGKQMRLERVEPHSRYTNLDRHIFACECGERSEFLVARRE
jgi:hypothetical protein